MIIAGTARSGPARPGRLSWQRLGVPLAVLLLVMLIGGSVQLPLLVMAAELLGAAALSWWIATARPHDWRCATPVLAALVALGMLAAWQLWPRSLAGWTALPGRETAAAVVQVARVAGSHPLSLDPDASRDALLMLVPALALALAGLTASEREARVLTRAVIAVALFSAALGALQIASGDQLRLYPESHETGAVGLFANRNHHADLLMIGLVLLAEEVRAARAGLQPALLALMALLAASVVMTGSRLGMAILPFALAAALLIGFGRRGRLPFAALLAAAAGGALLLLLDPAAGAFVARFGALGQDPRHVIWADTLAALHRTWPTGSGIGSFVPVYAGVESLGTMTDHYVVHAHNDYLEIALETGAPGVALAIIYVLALAAAVLRARRAERRIVAPLLGLLVLLVHSIGDYPLRTPALLALFGLLNGLVFAARPARPASHLYHNRSQRFAAVQ